MAEKIRITLSMETLHTIESSLKCMVLEATGQLDRAKDSDTAALASILLKKRADALHEFNRSVNRIASK